MHIVIINRWPRFHDGVRWDNELTRYEEYIDHAQHRVSYVVDEPGGKGVLVDPSRLAALRKVADVNDFETLRTAVAEIAAEAGPIDRLITLSEFTLEIAARVREALAIPGPTVDQVAVYRNKLRMKDVLTEAGIRVPRYAACTDAEQPASFARACGYPVILKPVDGAASIGVHRVDGEEQLAGLLPDLDLSRYEIEEFVEGAIHHVDGFADTHSQIGFQVVSRYLNTPLAFEAGAPHGSMILSNSPMVARIEEFTQHCVSALGLTSCPFHLELFVTETGELVFLEIGARVGGGDIPHLLHQVFGVNLYELWLRTLAGETIAIPVKSADPAGGMVMIPRPRVLPVRVIDGPSMRDQVPSLWRELVPSAGTILETGGGYDSMQSGRFILVHDEHAQVEADLQHIITSFELETSPLTEEQTLSTELAEPTELIELRRDTLKVLRDRFSAEHWSELETCVPKLRAKLEELGPLEDRVVMVAYGGGKDSAYTTAFVRAMQLLMFEEQGRTFHLRVITMRHAGMPYAVMQNIDRTYAALNLYQDAGCTMLLVDGSDVSTFHVDLPQPDHVVNRNRLDILVTGHRTRGDGRPTFCNACNLSAAHAFGLAASYDGGVDIIITGDSSTEQRTYLLWIHKLAETLGVAPVGEERKGFRGVLKATDNIGKVFFTDIYGADATELLEERRVHHQTPDQLRFFSIYDDTDYASGQHWDLLTGFLGFSFDELAFSFTESDCGNPALMAHIRGLKCERVYGRSYSEGIEEYLIFAEQLMRKKEFPEQLIEMILDRYRGPGALERMRASMDGYGRRTFGLNEEQLVCMVHAPFAEGAADLRVYLAAEQPGLVADADQLVRLVTSDETDVDPRLVGELERISGLPLAQLRVLARNPGRTLTGLGGAPGVVDLILKDDPHKLTIRTQHAPNGPLVDELISGR